MLVRRIAITIGLALALVSGGCQSDPAGPSPSQSARFVTVGDLELTRCSGESCDQFAFLLRNVGNWCASTIGFGGTVTLTKASGVTSTAHWLLDNSFDRVFKPGETRRIVQDGRPLYRGEVLLNPPGPHSYSVDTQFITPTNCG